MSNSKLSVTERKRSVANMMASLRIENLTPGKSPQISIQDYVEGKNRPLIYSTRSGQICGA
jgi:hypothetical protein